MLLAEIVINLVAAFLGICVYAYSEEAFALCPKHSQKVVGRNLCYWLGEFEVTAVLCRLRVFLTLFGNSRFHPSGAVNAAEGFPEGCCFTDTLRHNVTGAAKGCFRVLDVSLYELSGIGLRITGLAAPEEICKRFQAGGNGHCGAGLSLGTEREIDVFKAGRTHALLNFLLKFRGQFPGLIYGLQDQLLALFHFGKYIGPVLYLSNFNVSEAACALLAVAADEGHGAAVFKQFCAVEDLPGLNAQKSRYVVNVYIFHK